MQKTLKRKVCWAGIACLWAAWCAPVAAATREVGPGKTFTRIEDAIATSGPGDTILVHPNTDGAAYARVAVLLRTARLTIRGLVDGVVPAPGRRVKIDGAGYDYSGAGSVPRAIFQFDRGADGCVLEGFELSGARNDSHNGAGVRINQANDVTIRACDIHGNDMGVMSNGALSERTARNQRFEFCRVFQNGNEEAAGYNHNFYLGGASVTLHGCEVFESTTGHNVKSRAHFNRVEYCYIHDSANREFDLVDEAGNTDAPESHSVLLGNVIVKAQPARGNRAVVHFGQDGGKDHRGSVYLVHNTIVTPYVSPVIELSAPGASAELYNNLIWGADAGQRGQTLVAARAGGRLDGVRGAGNWIDATFTLPREVVLEAAAGAGARIEKMLREGSEGRILAPIASARGVINGGVALARITLPLAPGASEGSVKPLELREYRAACATVARRIEGAPDCGAYETTPK